jgi:hemoglobin/transferrin/lactoferrin receptor protein
MEIIKGPGSVLYGSDAVGGTVNAISMSQDLTESGIVRHGRAHYRYASAENANIGRVEIGGGIANRFSYIIGASYKDFGDLEGGRKVGTQPRTGYDEWNSDLKLEYHINRNSRITLLHQAIEQNDAWRTHKTIYGISWEGTTVGNEKSRILDQKRNLTYIQYEGKERLPFADKLTFTLSYQSHDEERSRVKSDDRSDIQGFDVNTVGICLQGDKYTAIGNWTYGMELYHDDVGSFLRKYNADGSLNSVEIQGPVADNATYDLVGVFVQNDMQSFDTFDIIVGARYSYFKADATEVRNPQDGSVMAISDNWDSVVGNLRALYYTGKEQNYAFFGGVSQGFRAPNLSDLTRFDTARSNEIETASPGLAPEKFITYETGFKTRHDRFTAQVSYFYTTIADMIIRTPTGNMIDDDYEVTKKNSGDGYVHGTELSLACYLLDQFRLSGSFSWLDGEIETYPTSASEKVKEPISRLMPPSGHLGIRWQPARKKFWFAGHLSVAGLQDDLSTRDRSDTQRIPPGGTPAYTVFDLRAGWEINRYINMSAAIENIGDVDYRIHGSGQNEPGRNFVIGLSYTY